MMVIINELSFAGECSGHDSKHMGAMGSRIFFIFGGVSLDCFWCVPTFHLLPACIKFNNEFDPCLRIIRCFVERDMVRVKTRVKKTHNDVASQISFVERTCGSVPR